MRLKLENMYNLQYIQCSEYTKRGRLMTTYQILNKIMYNVYERCYWIGFARVNNRQTLVQHLQVVHHNSVIELSIPAIWKDILIREVTNADYAAIADRIMELTSTQNVVDLENKGDENED